LRDDGDLRAFYESPLCKEAVRSGQAGFNAFQKSLPEAGRAKLMKLFK
jgi:hypothetical protein